MLCYFLKVEQYGFSFKPNADTDTADGWPTCAADCQGPILVFSYNMNVAIIRMSYTCFTSPKNNEVTEQRQIHSISQCMFNECAMATVEYKVQKGFHRHCSWLPLQCTTATCCFCFAKQHLHLTEINPNHQQTISSPSYVLYTAYRLQCVWKLLLRTLRLQLHAGWDSQTTTEFMTSALCGYNVIWYF